MKLTGRRLGGVFVSGLEKSFPNIPFSKFGLFERIKG
jgi:hypothetical protein